MRKIFVILLGLMLGWLCGTDLCCAAVPCANTAEWSAVEAADREELRCEREYNSDLGMPRTAVDVTPVSTFCVRTLSCPERLGIKCGVARGHDGARVECLPRFCLNLLLSGGGVADFYVYRLRRLII